MTQPASTWMSDPTIQARTLANITLPGTHDTGTFGVTPGVLASDPKYGYGTLAFLWRLAQGQAPAGVAYSSKGPLYPGQPLNEFIFQLIEDTSRAQEKSILQMLNAGVRSFDIRLYWDQNQQDVYTQHCLRCAPFSDIIADLATFIAQNPTAKELIVLELSHSNFNSDSQPNNADGLTKVANALQTIASSLYAPPSFDALNNIALGTITTTGTKVIALNRDAVTYPGVTVLNDSNGFAVPSQDAPAGVPTLDLLEGLQTAGLGENAPRLYSMNWCLTPDLVTLADELVSRLAGNPPAPVLQNLAQQANGALQGFLDGILSGAPSVRINRINTDWFETSPAVQACINLSMR